jgi:hypothetical protein
LPTGATGKAADSFRAGRRFFGAFFMLAHAAASRKRLVEAPGAPFRDSRHIDAMTIVKVT